MKEKDGGVLDVDSVSLRKVNVEDDNVAVDDEWGADEWDVIMWEGGGGTSEREVLKREFDDEGERMYGNTRNDGDGLRREEIV